MRFVSVVTVAGIVLLAFAPQSAATHAEDGPRDLALLETQDSPLLTWNPPANWSPVEYRIYADEQLVAVTEETGLVVEEATRYVVQAVAEDQTMQQASLVVVWGPGPTDCGYVTFNTDLDEPPFIFFRVHEGCFYWIWELINGDGMHMETRWFGGS